MSEVLQIKYIGLDFWSRPIFKPIDKTKNFYLSDVNNLFDCDTPEEEIKEFYANAASPLNEYITYHGKSIEDDPNGSSLKYELEIIW